MHSVFFLFHREMYHKVEATRMVDAKIKYQTYTSKFSQLKN